MSLELLLLLVILPAVHDQNHAREWLKSSIKAWCEFASWLLGIRSYLFGDIPLNEEQEQVREDEEEDIFEVVDEEEEPVQARLDRLQGEAEAEPEPDAALRAFLVDTEAPAAGFQPYNKPDFFAFRIAGLLFLTLVSWLLASLMVMLLPVSVGRQIFRLLLSDDSRVYELYTCAVGIYVCLLAVRGTALISGWVQQGWAQLSNKAKEWARLACKASVALFLMVGVIPLLFGFLLEVVVLMPVRVPMNQSPVYFLWQDWALGAMYTKISVALTFMGPDWWMKAAIERLYQDGLRGLSLSYLIGNLVAPVCVTLGLMLALPYVASHSLAPVLLSPLAANEEDLAEVRKLLRGYSQRWILSYYK